LPSSDNTQLNYFLCLAVVNKDFPKIKALMKAYIYVDFQKKDECDYFKDVNSYLFDSCKQQYRIWE
jgi:hypothetical protein